MKNNGILICLGFTLFFGCLGFLSCKNENVRKVAVENEVVHESVSDTNFYYGYDENGKEFKNRRVQLNNNQNREAQNLIERAVQDYNSENIDKIELEDYLSREEFGTKDSYGHIIVFVFYSCTKHHGKIQIVKDGGRCNFRTELNLSLKTYKPIVINSEA